MERRHTAAHRLCRRAGAMEVDGTEVANAVYVHFIKDGAAEDDDMELANDTTQPLIPVLYHGGLHVLGEQDTVYRLRRTCHRRTSHDTQILEEHVTVYSSSHTGPWRTGHRLAIANCTSPRPCN